MKVVRLLSVLAVLLAVVQALQSATFASNTTSVQSFGQLPLYFEPNLGQTNSEARFVAHGQGYSLFLTPTEAVLSLKSFPKKEDVLHQPVANKDVRSAVLRLELLNSNASPKISGRDLLPGYSNYFIGQDRSQWQTRVPQYSKVEYSQVYPGIDLLYYGNQRQLEYDFIAKPGSDPKSIAFQVQGGDKVELGSGGALIVHLGQAALELRKPAAYQQVNGHRREVAADYTIQKDGRIGFALGAYDASVALVIDPVLVYSSYLGGAATDSATAVAVDPTGNVYVVGQTLSLDFPVAGAFQPTNKGANAFLTKLSADGTAVVFSTFLGGTDTTCGGDRANAVALNGLSEAFVAGHTFSTDFPVGAVAYQKTGGGCSGGVGGSGFVTRFSADGTILKFSTYFGGLVSNLPTEILAIAVNQSSNNAFITGYDQTGTLATTGAFQTTLDAAGDRGAFVTKFSTDGAHLLFSTYVRAKTTGPVTGNSISLDRNGNSYIVGSTSSTSFPFTNGAFQKTYGGGTSDAFVTKVNSTGTKLVYSSYMGGSDADTASQVLVEFTFGAYVVGTTSSTNFPTTLGTLQATYPGGPTSAYAVRVASDGTRLNFSTFLGGNNGSSAAGVGFNPGCRAPCNLVVYGNTYSTNFPLLNSIQTTGDLFVTTIDGFGAAIPGYSTLLGSASGDVATGIAVDARLNAYVVGTTNSTSYPTTTGALQTSYRGGGSDGYISKVAMSSDLAVTQTASPSPVPVGSNLTYTITVTDLGIDNGVSLQLADTIPAGTTYVSITPSAGVCSPPPGQTGTARCTLPFLPSASGQNTWTVTLVVNVTGTSGQTIRNRANVAELGPDPNTVNNANTINVKIQ